MIDNLDVKKCEMLFQNGDVNGAVSLTETLLEQGIAAHIIMEHILVPALQKTGVLFEEGHLFLPHLMRAAEAMKRSVELLTPHFHGQVSTRHKTPVILGTVAGDIHDIGKNIVSLLLSVNGFEVVDLGASVSAEKFIEAVESQPHPMVIIGMSALLTTTMVQQEKVIKLLEERGLRGRTIVLIGGACTTREWATKIGADGYGFNAREAVTLARDLVAERAIG